MAGIAGTIVIRDCDDSPCPLTGKVVGQVDEETVEVLWGERQYEENPGTGTYEAMDSLCPVNSGPAASDPLPPNDAFTVNGGRM